LKQNSFSTVQNVAIQYQLAGLGNRILAYLIDLAIITAYCFSVFFIFFSNFSTNAEENIYYFALALLPISLYTLLFETFMNGQTPGKKALNIRVIKDDGSQPNIGNYFLRWILRIVDISLIYGSIAIIFILVNKSQKRLGDLAAGTLVVRDYINSGYLKKESSFISDVEYTPVYSEAKYLEAEYVDLIKESIQVYRNTGKKEPIEKMAEVLKKKLQVVSDDPDIKFLSTLIKDYNHYHSI